MHWPCGEVRFLVAVGGLHEYVGLALMAHQRGSRQPLLLLAGRADNLDFEYLPGAQSFGTLGDFGA